MCTIAHAPCFLLVPRDAWSHDAPLPPPRWIWDDVARFADAARCAAEGDLAGARDQFAMLREADARDWFVRHGQLAWVTRRSPEAAQRASTPRRIPHPQTSIRLRRAVHTRDHYVCRYCGLPTIAPEARSALADLLGPSVLSWGRTNAARHGTALAAWTQYDHVHPIALGGVDDETNIVTSCAACNYGKDQYTLAELELNDPRQRQPANTSWDGLLSLVQALRAQVRQ